MDEALRRSANLLVLKKFISDISAILDLGNYVACYKFNPVTLDWEKMNVEGTMFIYECSSKARGLIILNRVNPKNLIIYFEKSLTFYQFGELFIFNISTSEIIGIWVYDSEHRSRINQTLIENVNRSSAKIYKKETRIEKEVRIRNIETSSEERIDDTKNHIQRKKPETCNIEGQSSREEQFNVEGRSSREGRPFVLKKIEIESLFPNVSSQVGPKSHKAKLTRIGLDDIFKVRESTKYNKPLSISNPPPISNSQAPISNRARNIPDTRARNYHASNHMNYDPSNNLNYDSSSYSNCDISQRDTFETPIPSTPCKEYGTPGRVHREDFISRENLKGNRQDFISRENLKGDRKDFISRENLKGNRENLKGNRENVISRDDFRVHRNGLNPLWERIKSQYPNRVMSREDFYSNVCDVLQVSS